MGGGNLARPALSYNICPSCRVIMQPSVSFLHADVQNCEGYRAARLHIIMLLRFTITVTPCRLVNTYHHFERTWFLRFQGRKLYTELQIF
jgi:hypothetical protein